MAGTLALRPASFYADHRITLRLGERAALIDRPVQQLELTSGERWLMTTSSWPQEPAIVPCRFLGPTSPVCSSFALWRMPRRPKVSGWRRERRRRGCRLHRTRIRLGGRGARDCRHGRRVRRPGHVAGGLPTDLYLFSGRTRGRRDPIRVRRGRGPHHGSGRARLRGRDDRRPHGRGRSRARRHRCRAERGARGGGGFSRPPTVSWSTTPFSRRIRPSRRSATAPRSRTPSPGMHRRASNRFRTPSTRLAVSLPVSPDGRHPTLPCLVLERSGWLEAADRRFWRTCTI